MTMQLLVARRFPRRLTFTVHLDTTRLLVDGTTPDPAWVMSQTWPIPPRTASETAPQYGARATAWATATRAEFRQACIARLAELEDAADLGIALPGEGSTF